MYRIWICRMWGGNSLVVWDEHIPNDGLEVEYRFPFQKQKETLSGVVFLNGTSTGSRTSDIDLMQYLVLGYGLDSCVILNKQSCANLNIDIAGGEYGAKGFYL